MKKLSIRSWPFLFGPDQPTTDFHALVHKLMHLGYLGFELGAYAPHPNLESHDTPEKRQKLRKMVVDHRLEFSALEPDLRSQQLWSVEEPSAFVATFEKHVGFASNLGIKTICVNTVEPAARAIAAGIEPKRVFDRCVVAFDRCAKVAAGHGISFAWGFDPAFPIHTPVEIRAFVDAVRGLGNANFGALFNTCNAHLCTEGQPLALLQSLAGTIVHVQVGDCDGTLDEQRISPRCPLGKGVIDFEALAPALWAHGISSEWCSVDLAHCSDPWSLAPESKRFLDKLRHKHAS
jgi:sugar phosphate isomerase/epimerase